MAACLVLLLSGCANWLALPLLKVAPAALGPARTVEQRVSFTRRDESRSFDSVVEISADRLDVVATAVGVRLFTLSYNGETLEEGAGLPMPGGLPPEWVINDLLYVFAPADALQSALPEGWLVLDAESSRQILKGGEPVIAVSYSGGDRWNGRALLEQKRLGYRLQIDSQVVE
jgi:hypothetical protein